MKIRSKRKKKALSIIKSKKTVEESINLTKDEFYKLIKMLMIKK